MRPEMATLHEIYGAIDKLLQDPDYDEPEIVSLINQALQEIAAGVRMPDGGISPPLPDLVDYDTVTTTAAAYASLPDDYQRGVFLVLDSSGYRIDPPRGGGYYAFALFMNQIQDKRLTEAGSVYRVVVKGSRLYYQGIPTAAATLGVHFFRKPATLYEDEDVPEGIPEHLQLKLLKHWVLKDVFGEAIEDGQDNVAVAAKYHTTKAYEALTALCDFIGIDGSPEYYGAGDFVDMGVCD
jgi:hypothetical protein